MRFRPFIILCLLAAAETLLAQEPAPTASRQKPVSHVERKKLIRVGSELVSQLLAAPSIAEADLPGKVKLWQQTGLDGLVFSIASHDRSKGYHNMSGQWWNMAPRSYEEFVPEIKAFQSVNDWGRLTDNFLWSSMAVWDRPGLTSQDWFSDDHWQIILANVQLQARIAKECGFKGILLDVEQYAHHGEGPWRFPFNYKRYAGSGYKLAGEEIPRPLSVVQDKVHDRAKQYARTICEAYPGITLILIPAIYRPYGLTEEETLYPSFIDGLLIGLDERASLVAGSEYTYLDSQYRNMAVIRDGTIRQFLANSKHPVRMRSKLSFAAGIWTDGGHGTPEERFSETDANVNQRNPERHKHAVHNALAASGKYAWVYGERSYYLTTTPTPLIRRYWQANFDGHEPLDLNWKPVPKWDMTDYSDHDRRQAEADATFWSQLKRKNLKIAFEFPAHWHFMFDTEQRGRFISTVYSHDAWPLLSTLKCWQSQSVKANGEGVYRIRFQTPANVDPRSQTVYLAFGGFTTASPQTRMVVRLNGKGYPIDNLVDVTESTKPDGSNFLAIEVINKSGPAGPLGHVKLLVR